MFTFHSAAIPSLVTQKKKSKAPLSIASFALVVPTMFVVLQFWHSAETLCGSKVQNVLVLILLR